MSTENNMGGAKSVIGSGELPLQESLMLLKHILATAQNETEPDNDTGMFFVSRRSNDGTDVEVQTIINPVPSSATGSREGKFSRFAEIAVDDGTDNPDRYGLWFCGDSKLPRGLFYELRPADERSPWSEGVVQRILGIMSVHANES